MYRIKLQQKNGFEMSITVVANDPQYASQITQKLYAGCEIKSVIEL